MGESSPIAIAGSSGENRRDSVRANVLANFAGSGFTALMAIAMSPVYLHLLGKEAFGLVALFNTLTAIVAIFEFGISAALSRQMARSQNSSRREVSETTASLELLYATIGLLLGGGLCICGPFIADYWLNPGSLDGVTITWSMIWLGIGFAGRWNVSFYGAGLNGLERQVGLNVVMVLAAIVQYLGVVVILWYWAATPPVFFAYLAGCGVIHMLILRHLLWQRVGWNQSYRRWSKAAFVQVRGFAGGMTLISLTTIFLTQIDKIVLSRLMPLYRLTKLYLVIYATTLKQISCQLY